MCDTTRPVVSRGRWGSLYGATVPPLAALAVVEVAAPPNVVRTALRLVLGLGAFAGMALWVRSSRAAFDLADWCDCAGQTMTVRVIESYRPLPSTPPAAAPVLDPDTAAEEYEPAQR
jgi:hypothetical protein